MNKRAIISLTKLTLAECSVLFTLGTGSALIIAGALAAMLADFIGKDFFPLAISGLWLLLVFWMWLHFHAAFRRRGKELSSARLFYTIQLAGLAFAGLALTASSALGWRLFVIISLGMEVAVTAFCLSYILLAVTLCGRVSAAMLLSLLASVTVAGFISHYCLSAAF